VTSLATQPFSAEPDLLIDDGIIRVVPMPLWKRLVDVTGAAILLVLCVPLFAMVSLAIVVDSRGGPFYRQVRVGRGGQPFVCWKFRSMHRGADRILDQLQDHNEAKGLIFKMKDDPRRTRVGKLLRKTSIDELPQLINVLAGDMSLVGPRPPLVSEVLGYNEAELQRLACVPGITGLWQVTLRGRHEFGDMVALDTEYASSITFWSDVRILLRTIPTVLFGKGSY
jgi:lipopolysaccharide/colanic/teichoic acid biosynthesis glycosyltransferase